MDPAGWWCEESREVGRQSPTSEDGSVAAQVRPVTHGGCRRSIWEGRGGGGSRKGRQYLRMRSGAWSEMGVLVYTWVGKSQALMSLEEGNPVAPNRAQWESLCLPCPHYLGRC